MPYTYAMASFPWPFPVTAKRIEFDLIGNAKDSLRHTVSMFVNDDAGPHHARLKHAILSSAHCIELLLKERLRRVHPALVWENVDKYPNLEARTVTSALALERLKRLGGLTFDADDERTIKDLRVTRNAVEHYEWRTTEHETQLIVGKALSFALSFAKAHLDVDLSEDFRKDDTWMMLLNEFFEFAWHHGKRIEAELSARSSAIAECQECGAMTVPVLSNTCRLCGHWQQYDDNEE